MRGLILILAVMMFCGVVYAAKVYRYRCPKCKLIQEYEVQGSKRCPNDGRLMIRVN